MENDQQPIQEINGILLIDKPQDWTSHDVVNCIRGRFRLKKVGHCGTLDPLATGLLVIVIGKATKLAETYAGEDKTYQATLRLGITTDSQDTTGKVLSEQSFTEITPEQVRSICESFIGEQLQIPPMVSAIKKHGQPLYKLARKGQEIVREPRPITIKGLTITRIEIPEVDLTVHCSKGTYIRTLCADIGDKLGCGGCMSALRRCQSGAFRLNEKTLTMDQIKEMERQDIIPYIIPLDEPKYEE